MYTGKKLRGLVLSGGESRRMGRDKGLIKSNSVAWVNRAGGLLNVLNLPVSIMIREAQRAAYEGEIFPGFELITDLDLNVHGPLRGLLSFHRYYLQSDVLVIPCDMPNISAQFLSDLISFYESKPDFEAWVFKDTHRQQPFPGIYSATLLARIFKDLQTNTLVKTSLIYVLDSGKTACKQVAINIHSTFLNANSPEDL